jgi:hypothetical protein
VSGGSCEGDLMRSQCGGGGVACDEVGVVNGLYGERFADVASGASKKITGSLWLTRPR